MISPEKKEYNHQYYAEHRAEILLQKKDYRMDNLSARRAYDHKRWVENRDRLRLSNREQYLKNRDRRIAESKKYRTENRDKVLAGLRAYRERNKDKLNAQSKEKYPSRRDKQAAWWQKYYAANRTAIRNRMAKWQRDNRDKVQAYQSKRRAIKLGCNPSPQLAEAFYSKIRQRMWVRCYYCGTRIRGKDAHIDHVVALARGGNHAVQNLAASCQHCNQSKGMKLPHEWPKHPQMFLTI